MRATISEEPTCKPSTKYPYLAKCKKNPDIIVMFIAERKYIVVGNPTENYPIGYFDVHWPCDDDAWTILPPGSSVTLIQE